MFKITREKHLDHMVKVVPFIVGCYAVQCYVIMKTGPGDLATISLSILGGFLALMIAGFVCYDLKHQVEIFEDHLKINFLGKEKTIFFVDVKSVHISDPGQSFSTLTLHTTKGKCKIYFVDEAEKIKSWIEDKGQEQNLAA